MNKLIEIYNKYCVGNIIIAVFIILFVIQFNIYSVEIIFLTIVILVLDILNALAEYLIRTNKKIALDYKDLFIDTLNHADEATKLNKEILNTSDKTIEQNSEILKFNDYLISKISSTYEVSTIEWAIKECYVDINRKVIKRNIDSWKDKYIFIDKGKLVLHEQNSDNILFTNTETFTEDFLAKDWIVVDKFAEDLVSKDWNDYDNTITIKKENYDVC